VTGLPIFAPTSIMLVRDNFLLDYASIFHPSHLN